MLVNREHKHVLKMKRERYNAWMPFDFLCKNRQKQLPQITKHYDFFTQTFALLTFPETIMYIVLSTNQNKQFLRGNYENTNEQPYNF